MRRFMRPLRGFFPLLVLAALLGPALARPVAVERRAAHPNGTAITVRTIDLREDSIILNVAIANSGEREIALNRDRSLVLEDGAHGVYRLNPPADNPEIRVPAHKEVAGTLVFVGPLASGTGQLILSSNRGIGAPDNPYDNAPAFDMPLPVPGTESGGRIAAHPNGAVLRLRRVVASPGACVVSLLAVNGNDQPIALNRDGSFLLTDDHGISATLEPPADNPDLTIPPGRRLDGELVFRCRAVAPGSMVTLSSNRGAGGTVDNPFDPLPVFTVRAPVEPGGDTAPPASRASLSVVAASHLSRAGEPVTASAAPPSRPSPPAANPARAEAAAPRSAGPLGPVLQEVQSASRPAAAAPAPAPKPSASTKQVELEAALHAEKTDRGMRIVFPAEGLFGTEPDTLEEGADQRLAKLAELIAAARPREVVIAGHTDSSGDDDENLAVSGKRAHAVAAWLAAHLPKRGPRLVEKAYGRTRPLAPNHLADGSDNPEGRAQNRRIEIILRR